jgi:hypothetical protein
MYIRMFMYSYCHFTDLDEMYLIEKYLELVLK